MLLLPAGLSQITLSMLLLAQANPEDAIGWAERMNRGGVPVICLCVAIAAITAVVFMFRKVLEANAEKAAAIGQSRDAIQTAATDDRAGAERRLSEERNLSAARERESKADQKALMETLAHAVLVIEAAGKALEKDDHDRDEIRRAVGEVHRIVDRVDRAVADLSTDRRRA